MTQFITGHNYLNYHRSLANPTVDRTCRLCNQATEDSWHLLSECEALAFKSYSVFLSNHITKLPHPKLVLQYIRQTRIVELMEPPEEDRGTQDEDDNPPPGGQ